MMAGMRRTSGALPAKFPGQLRRSFLDTGRAEDSLQLGHEVRQLDQVRHAAGGTPAREGDEGVGVPAVCQRPVDRPQPAVFAPEVQRVFPPVAVDDDDRVLLPIPRMERMFDAEPITAFLRRGCS